MNTAMKKENDIFSPLRFGRLIYINFMGNLKSTLITFGGFLGFYLFISLMNGLSGEPEGYLQEYIAIFMVGGIFLSVRSFRHYYRRERNTPLLMLPASKTEKWMEKFLISTVIWMAVSFAVFTLCTLISAGLNQLIFGYHTSPVWWDNVIWEIYLHYLVVQSIFFLGSSVFRKTALFKTLLSLFIISTVIAILSAFFFRFMFGDLFRTVMDLHFGRGIIIHPGDINPEAMVFFRKFGTAVKIFYWAFIMPFCWAVSYIRFTEIEVKDGV